MATLNPEPRPAPVILVVDDEEWMRDACGLILGKEGYQVQTAAESKTGLEQVVAVKPDLLLVDVRMPGVNGIEFIRRAKAIDSELVAVVITGYATIEVAVDAMKAGAHDFLAKPFEPRELRGVVRRGLEQRRLQDAAAAFNREPAKGTKSLSAAVLAHQLKSPVAALQQCLEVVIRGYAGELPTKARGMVEIAARRAEQAIGLLDNWLILLRLEDGDFISRTEAVDLAALLRDEVAIVSEAHEAAGKTVRFVGGDAPVTVRGDKNALAELFKNLLNNAVRYTPAGAQITIDTVIRGDDVLASVSDNGNGIPPEERERVFAPFYRGRANRTIPGDGLGLPIARHIALAHGGDLKLESEVGKGTTFQVILPTIEEARRSGAGGAPAPDARGTLP
jgi:two-component system, sensor histidine kinase and response regulator